VARIVRRYVTETGARPFEARDIRRTWKTLAGAAGIFKETRDRLQNHALRDVSARHYDRWDYMPEKREAMRVWSQFLDQILTSGAAPAYEQLPSKEVLASLRSAMNCRPWRGSPQARHQPDWIGYPVAKALQINQVGDWKAAAWKQSLRLVQLGVLERSIVRDHKSRQVPVFSFSGAGAEVHGLAIEGNAPAASERMILHRSVMPAPSPEILLRLRGIMAERPWRAAPQARRQKDWIGNAIAEAFEYDRKGEWRPAAARLALELERHGLLVRGEGADQTERLVPVFTLSENLPAAPDVRGGRLLTCDTDDSSLTVGPEPSPRQGDLLALLDAGHG
jgi:hypothetical protein